MIKTTVILVLSLVLMAGSGWADKIIIKAIEPVDLSLISNIESGGHPEAHNSHSGAVGLCQITPIVLKEYNSYYGLWYKEADLYNGDFNKIVANWYMNKRIPQMLRAYKLEDTLKNRLWAYNAGIGKVKRGIMPLETKNYIKKYYKLKGEL